MKRIYVRYYDQNNLGDDLFVRILSDRYTNPLVIRKAFNSGSYAPSNARVIQEGRMTSIVDKVLSRLLKTRFFLSMPTIRSTDLLVYIGGSLFMDNAPFSYWAREEKFYKSINIPYYILGSNIGPVSTKEFIKILERIFRNAQDVCFRDTSSYALLKDAPTTRVATDIAFSLNTNLIDKVSKEKTAVFSIIDAYKKFDDITAKKYDQTIIDMTNQLLLEDYEVTYMSFCKDEGDENAIYRILGHFEGNVKIKCYMYENNLDEALGILAKNEMVIASRFHATILGLLFGKKVLPIAYSDKTTNILNDMGFKGPIVDIRKIDTFYGKKFELSKLQVNDVTSQVKLAEKQFQELDKVLKRRT